LKGLPIKVIAPEEGYVYASGELTLLRNAPHSNAARLLINHFLEEEAQLSFANAGLIPARTGVIPKVSADMRPLVSAKLLGSATAEARPRMNEIAAKIYK
jgi:iron(III) transport system substrate-binding protein